MLPVVVLPVVVAGTVVVVAAVAVVLLVVELGGCCVVVVELVEPGVLVGSVEVVVVSGTVLVDVGTLVELDVDDEDKDVVTETVLVTEVASVVLDTDV